MFLKISYRIERESIFESRIRYNKENMKISYRIERNIQAKHTVSGTLSRRSLIELKGDSISGLLKRPPSRHRKISYRIERHSSTTSIQTTL